MKNVLLICLLMFPFTLQAQETEIITTTTPVTTTTTNPTVVERQVIVTPVPATTTEKVVPTPAGYVSCFKVAAGWNQNVWVAEHQVCQYSTSANNPAIEGVTWVEGYWACPRYNSKGECTNWEWKPGKWVKTLEVY